MQFAVEYPDRPLNRLTTALRPFVAIPILIVLVSIGGVSADWAGETRDFTIATLGGILFVPPLLMIVFRRKYPRWWFDFNLELQRFTNRVSAYLALMEDRYPSTDEEMPVTANGLQSSTRALQPLSRPRRAGSGATRVGADAWHGLAKRAKGCETRPGSGSIERG